MTLDHRVMHGPARQHLRQRMAHELADPQLTLREHLARAGIALMPSAGHDRPAWPSCPDWSAYPSACEGDRGGGLNAIARGGFELTASGAPAPPRSIRLRGRPSFPWSSRIPSP